MERRLLVALPTLSAVLFIAVCVIAARASATLLWFLIAGFAGIALFACIVFWSAGHFRRGSCRIALLSVAQLVLPRSGMVLEYQVQEYARLLGNPNWQWRDVAVSRLKELDDLASSAATGARRAVRRQVRYHLEDRLGREPRKSLRREITCALATMPDEDATPQAASGGQ